MENAYFSYKYVFLDCTQSNFYDIEMGNWTELHSYWNYYFLQNTIFRSSATNQVAEKLPPFFVTVLPHHFRSAILICEGIYMSMYVPKLCTKVFKSGFVKFCSNKKDLNLLRNLHAYVHTCNGTKLFKSGIVKFCSDKKTTSISICTYGTKMFKSSCQILCK